MLASCSKGNGVPSQPGGLDPARVEGAWTLTLIPEQPEPGSGISIKVQPGTSVLPQPEAQFRLDVFTRDGRVSSCTLSDSGSGDNNATCRLDNGHLVVAAGNEQAQVRFIVADTGERIEGSAFMD